MKLMERARKYLFSTKRSEELFDLRLELTSEVGRIRSTLLRWLADPAMRSRWLHVPRGPSGATDTPLHRACELLDEALAPDLVPLVSPFLIEGSEEVRRAIALLLGSIGSAACVPPLHGLLRDQDPWVRLHCVMGLERARKAGRLEPACIGALFAALATQLSQPLGAKGAVLLLLSIDQGKALATFHDLGYFEPGSSALEPLLTAMNELGILLPRAEVLSLLDKLEAEAHSQPGAAQGPALQMLGGHRAHADRRRLERLMVDGGALSVYAARALMAWHGLTGLFDRIVAHEREVGFAGLSSGERMWAATEALHAEINNGGLAQYFFNSWGDQWRVALAGLQVMDDPERADILQAALGRFGPDGPSEDREARYEQLRRLHRKQDHPFRDLDDRYYAVRLPFEVATARWVIANQQLFG
ncbi:MAG: DUF4375 domain-containing protein [Planctomycetes bacterium]|nr:DUF4375 domain-containing protein [Planctomycetota bacterium]